jgi:hypothetical protein
LNVVKPVGVLSVVRFYKIDIQAGGTEGVVERLHLGCDYIVPVMKKVTGLSILNIRYIFIMTNERNPPSVELSRLMTLKCTGIVALPVALPD